MTDASRLDQVWELRQRGLSPKQIAHTMGLSAADVKPLIRQVAGRRRSPADEPPPSAPAEGDVVGCWINAGWSAGLGLDDAPEWAALDPDGATEGFSSGLAGVLVARQENAGRVSVCGYLVDVYCLGVKDALGPVPMTSGSLTSYTRRYFRAFEGSPRSIPIELAQHLVHGAVAYARALGFEPHRDFRPAAPHLGAVPDHMGIKFGRHGKPFFISGPNDDPFAVMSTLGRTVGSDNYHFLTDVPA